ncbi:CD1247 N-terminal domain-containing protein, partial [Symbiobacterium thermophilum]|uniref:AraC family transcriptional regulator n=1 Tax=Symbiobacterium thermophilum TaxID=2734 RepID=A0A953I2B7_SYMTR
MTDLRSRVAYLQGLAEGLAIDVDSAHGRVLAGVLDVLGDIAEEIEEITEFQGDLAEYVDEMDDDLSSVEDEVYNENEIVFIPDDADDVTVLTCSRCGEPIGAQAGEVDDEDLEVTCPVCGCTMEADEVDD